MQEGQAMVPRGRVVGVVSRKGERFGGRSGRSVALPYASLLACCFLVVAASAAAQSQRRPLEPVAPAQPQAPQHRVRLFLKDGSYQVVLSYKVKGDRVQYRSAERDGDAEEIPLALVDLPATEAWMRAHDPATTDADGQAGATTVLSPELAREEAERAAQTPEVAPDLRLPEGDSVLVLDTFHGVPELVPLGQAGSDLNRETAHATLKREVNPAASPHDLFLLKEERADVQLHVPDPVFYVRLQGGGAAEQSGASFVVDTQGQAGRSVPEGGAANSTYVLERVEVRQGARAVASFRVGAAGEVRAQPDVIPLKVVPLPGGVWEKLTPTQGLEFGEYALLEVLSERAINGYAWDFGVHPTARENDEALRPEPKRPAQLGRRRP